MNDIDNQIEQLKQKLAELEHIKDQQDVEQLLNTQPRKDINLIVYKSSTRNPVKFCKTFNELFDYLETKITTKNKVFFNSDRYDNLSTQSRLQIVRRLKDDDGWGVLISMIYIGNIKTEDVIYEVIIESEQLRYFDNVLDCLRSNRDIDPKTEQQIEQIKQWRLFDSSKTEENI